ncbi:autotransporter outer membrane beta-barrel domain-containing protein [Pseudomonas sp. RP23018S]|uniref:autotransporter family protein n=1 Tax=Pseudomonas sp. RP23018S TaxID=3096037 RepID=UPI002ACA37A6|nr:autotransporter outer membrane beta-barrel domain-containing protein [Pseudomonas sp. RP23018S]MDZ5602663.1 autotransporter outer membrane beta-barrel domain-containing protein [Pseudomonas sp. RP23018S]
MRAFFVATGVTLASLISTDLQAACTFSPGLGDDAYTCDSASAPGLVDVQGNNSLALPAGGTGVIAGNVLFGPGQDTLDMASGRIEGSVNQGAGIDTFSMTGGVITGGVNQGDGLDRFFMRDGWIVGTFDSGDYAEMDGGRIGTVNMRLDQNTFLMRGGTIDRNLVTGFDRDYVELFAGTIGGNISVSGGDDRVLIHGGRLGGDVLMSTGNDQFSWDGGSIGGLVQMGPGDDRALLRQLGPEQLTITVDGGDGQDALRFEQSNASQGSLYPNWEQVELADNSRFTLDDTWVLGDAASSTGTVAIDASSQLRSRSGVIRAFAADPPATLNNAGLIDLSSSDGMGRLTVQGNYVGSDGTLKLASVLAGDNAPSDRLVVNQGSIDGRTLLVINNLGGVGAATTVNGIQVVEAGAGTTSSATAFVQTQVLSAGAYDYRLFKGGLTAGSENSWYLRSTLAAPVVPPPPAEPPVVTPPTETPVEPPVVTPPIETPVEPPLVTPSPETPVVQAPAVTPPVAAPALGQSDLPVAAPGNSVPLYRPEVPVYSVAPRAAALTARQALGTFHQRQGDQRLLTGNGALPASWGQAYGGRTRQQWSGTVNPSFDGDIAGWRVGQDLFAFTTDGGYRQQVGFYVGHSRLDGDVKGSALAQKNREVGDLRLDADSVAAYWTVISPQQAYLDSVVQYSRLDGRARSDRGGRLDLDGDVWTASLEAGYPIPLSPHWRLEPQAQVIAQRTALDGARDQVSRVDFEQQTELTARLGARLEADLPLDGAALLQPYVQVNLWHGDGGRDTVVFDQRDRLRTDYRHTSMQVETGVVAVLSDRFSVHGGVQYSQDLDGREHRGVGANVGLRWSY